ncbi:WxL domain-containing protein [Enterococcus ureilyticus]|uniref:WxL domain-containing protein n=1 Tax=Enterococcus ureilyticus TaxID=1131292 RepID=UPI001A91B747|nr:WxL domain-containing protein [Enterococcus ureilyticus]MBO0445098.1 WxL domain-containing protein [Enterococcus ureilyticus]
MKRMIIASMLLVLLGTIAILPSPQQTYAQSNSKSNGHITFTGDYDEVGIRDPEKPDQLVDPGDSPSTSGNLRIDFVPQLNFTSANKISDKDTVYPVNAQLFHDDTAARGNFVQISDYRGAALGWTLQLRQENQFQNTQTANSQLDGAYLSLDKSWVNSTMEQTMAPNVSKEVIRLDNIGATYNLAEAKSGTGAGTWSISFGASSDNPAGMSTTLSKKKDQTDKPMLDAAYENKQMHENSALTLSVPGATKKDPVTYSTVLTWILAELP